MTYPTSNILSGFIHPGIPDLTVHYTIATCMREQLIPDRLISPRNDLGTRLTRTLLYIKDTVATTRRGCDVSVVDERKIH